MIYPAHAGFFVRCDLSVFVIPGCMQMKRKHDLGSRGSYFDMASYDRQATG